MSKDIDINESAILETLNAKIDYDGGNYPNSGLETYINKASYAKYLSKNQITNCKTEIPQNIKLELSGSTLILRTGSKVIIPNGFEADRTTPKFDYVTVESDITYSAAYTSSVACYAVYDQTQKAIAILAKTDTNFSYDSTINKVVHSGLSGHNLSFPIALVHRDTTGIGSLDQVFNGMGHIGLTTWVDKGVKALIPYGRNADGTLNNAEKVTDKVTLMDCFANYNQAINLYPDGNVGVYGYEGVFEQDTPPKRADNHPAMLWFNPIENLWRYTDDGGATWNMVLLTPIGGAKTNAHYISEFNPKETFRAVDYNDFNKSINTLSKAYIVETYINGTSGYRIWSDGYCEQWGRTTFGTIAPVTVTLFKQMRDTNYNCQVTLFGETNGYNNNITGTYYTCWNLTTTSFQHHRYNSNTLQQMWKVSGYIA